MCAKGSPVDGGCDPCVSTSVLAEEEEEEEVMVEDELDMAEAGVVSTMPSIESNSMLRASTNAL